MSSSFPSSSTSVGPAVLDDAEDSQNIWNQTHRRQVIASRPRQGWSAQQSRLTDLRFTRHRSKDKETRYPAPPSMNLPAVCPAFTTMRSVIHLHEPDQTPKTGQDHDEMPPWLLYNTEDSTWVNKRWEKGFDHADLWAGWGKRQAIDNLKGLYNLQGKLQRQEMLSSDELDAALQWICRRSVDDDLRVWLAPATPAWSSDISDQVNTQPGNVRGRLYRADMAVFICHWARPSPHWTGLAVNQWTGEVYSVDTVWEDGYGDTRFCIAISRLISFYKAQGAPSELTNLLNERSAVWKVPTQAGGWTCGIWVLEWTRSFIREGQPELLMSSVHASFESQYDSLVFNVETFERRMIGNWMRWISCEFGQPLDGNQGAMLRPHPRRPRASYTEAASKKDAAERAAKNIAKEAVSLLPTVPSTPAGPTRLPSSNSRPSSATSPGILDNRFLGLPKSQTAPQLPSGPRLANTPFKSHRRASSNSVNKEPLPSSPPLPINPSLAEEDEGEDDIRSDQPSSTPAPSRYRQTSHPLPQTPGKRMTRSQSAALNLGTPEQPYRSSLSPGATRNSPIPLRADPYAAVSQETAEKGTVYIEPTRARGWEGWARYRQRTGPEAHRLVTPDYVSSERMPSLSQIQLSRRTSPEEVMERPRQPVGHQYNLRSRKPTKE
jgi:hypothetical protein